MASINNSTYYLGVENANTYLPPLGLGIEPLLGSKYVRAALN